MIRSRDFTRTSSSSWLNGFGMKSSAPASIAFFFSGPMLEVTMITGSTAVVLALAERLAYRVSVHPRHDHVEQDQIGPLPLDELERLARRTSRSRTV